MRKLLVILACLFPFAAGAQSVRQSGNVTPGHAACWAITGVIFDCGAPGGGVSVVGSTTQNDFAAFNGSGSLVDSGINPTATSSWTGLQNFNGGATVPTRPSGDATNNVADTAFVNNIFSTPGTWTALQNFNGGFACTQTGLTACMTILQTPTGTLGGTGNVIFNSISTPSDNAQMALPGQGILQEVAYNFGGTSMTGYRTGLYVAINQQSKTGNTSGSGINGNYVALLVNGFGEDNDNGTGSCTSGAPQFCRGTMFGQTNTVELHNGATFWSGVTALELNVNVYSGASVWGKTGMQISSSTTDATQGLGLDAALAVYNQGPSGITWKRGISFDDLFGNPTVAHFPIASTGTIIYAGAATSPVANGVDFSGLSAISGCAFKSRGNFCVDGSGNLTTGGFLLSLSSVSAFNQTALPSGGTTDFGYEFFSTAHFGIFGGTTTPTLSAAKGSLYLENNLGIPYYNSSGSTTWVALATSSTPVFTGAATFQGQIISTFGAASIASGACGASTNGSVAGTNASGLITIGASATATCTVSFSTTITAPGACVVFPANATAAVTGTTVARVSSVSATNFVISGTALASSNYYYICL